MKLKRAGETTEDMFVDTVTLCAHICIDCASAEQIRTLQDVSQFEEVDCPIHCSECGALFVTSLTTDGAAYVNKKVKEADGDPIILKLWADEFSWAIEDNDEEEEDGQEN